MSAEDVALSEIKGVVLDRDGTLIHHVPYLSNPAEVRLLPTVKSGLHKLKSAGCKLFLHTNQSGIGRGYYPHSAAIQCNDAMIRQIGLGADLFEIICIAPEAPDEEIVYRKPSPKFGLKILSQYNLKVEEICYIGDNVTDLLTAKNIGCRGVGVNTALHDLNQMLADGLLEEHFPVFNTFWDAATYILEGNRYEYR